MRIILKIIAAPAVLALTLIVAVLNFSVSLASWVLGILSLILAVCGLFELFIQSNPQWGITGLVLAFLLSPFGLPAAAEWLVCRLDDLNYSLKTFIAGWRFGTICPEVLCGGWSTAAVFFSERRRGYRYNLYPALQGSGRKNCCPDDGGSVCLRAQSEKDRSCVCLPLRSGIGSR